MTTKRQHVNTQFTLQILKKTVTKEEVLREGELAETFM